MKHRSFLIGICMVWILADAAYGSVNLPFVTTFSGDSVGSVPAVWSPSPTAPTVSGDFGAPGDSRSVLFAADSRGLRATLNSMPEMQDIQWDFWVRPTGTGRSLTVGSYDSSNREGIWVSFGVTPGLVSYYANGVWTSIPGTAFSTDKWYRVRIVGRVGSLGKSFDFYMSDGVGQNLPGIPQGVSLAFRNAAATGFSAVHFGTYGFATPVYVDDSVVQQPFVEGFETYPAADFPSTQGANGWLSTGTTKPKVGSGGAGGSSQSLRFYQSGNRIQRTFEATEELTADFQVNTEGTSRSVTVTLVDSMGRQGPYVSFGVSSGKVGYYSNGQWTHLNSPLVTVGAWHRVRIVARMLPSPSYDLYVGGANQNTLPAVPQAAGIPFRDSAATEMTTLVLDGFSQSVAAKIDSLEVGAWLDPLPPAPGLGEREIENSVYANRKPPLKELPSGSTPFVISVAAPVSGTGDSWQLIQDAVNTALGKLAETNPQPVEIRFPANSTYYLKPYGGAEPSALDAHCITIFDSTKRLKNLLINGNGATFIVQNPYMGFAKVDNCENVIIKNMKVDYDPLPYVQGVVVGNPSTADGKVTVNISGGYPDFGSGFPHIRPESSLAGIVYETSTRKMKRDVRTGGWLWFNGNSITAVNAPGERKYEVTLQTKTYADVCKDGDTIVFWNKRRPVGVVRAVNSQTVTVMDVTAYASPNTGFSGVDVSELNLVRCNLLLKSGRMSTTNADAATVFGGARMGPWIEGCTFENPIDDISQNEGNKVPVAAVLAAAEHALEVYAVPSGFEVGNTIVFFNMKNAVPFFEAKIQSIASLGSGNKKVTFDRELPVNSIYPAMTTQTVDITILFNKNYTSSNFVIKNNVVKNSLGNGIVSFTPKSNGIVEHNRFENGYACFVGFLSHASPTYYGLRLIDNFGVGADYNARVADAYAKMKNLIGGNGSNTSAIPAFTESIIIRNNYFLEGLTTNLQFEKREGALEFFFYGADWNSNTHSIAYQDVIIRGNRFENIARRMALRISNARDVSIHSNTFANTFSNPSMAYFLQQTSMIPSVEGFISIDNSFSVDVVNNSYSGQINPGTVTSPNPPVFVGEATSDINVVDP